MAEGDPPEAPRRVLVWDLPTRIAHWLLVVLIPFSWWSAEIAHRLDWHRISGYTILGVVVFRLLWGAFGSETAQFSHFVRGPRAIAAYLRGTTPERIGHTPLGALSVVVLILLLSAQVTFGLFAVDVDGIESGPLSDRVSFETGRQFAELHGLTFNILLGFIALHLGAIVFYALRRKNLVGPMITGRRPFNGEGARRAPIWRFALGLLVAAGLAYFISKGLRPHLVAADIAALRGGPPSAAPAAP